VSGSEEGKAHELVIIRRRAATEDGGHHGGVWKIAYADFMTAMMAFFLVMWLINSTDKKTLTQVATYFNPLRLTDKKPTPKGLHEPDGSEGAESEATPSNAKTKDSGSKGSTRRDESELGEVRPRGQAFQHGKEAKEQEHRSGTGGQTDQSAPQPMGRSFRDPFDAVPRTEIAPSAPSGSRAERPQPPPIAATGEEAAGKHTGEQVEPLQKEAPRPGAREKSAEAAKDRAQEPAKEAGAIEAGKETSKETSKEAGVVEAAVKDGPATAAKDAARIAADREDAAQLQAALRKAVAEALPGASPNVEVTEGPDGVLISLTDDQAFGMFAIASAEPRPAMVVVMDKVAQILQGRPEPLIVRGHTDRRPYRNTVTYDNWRLSAARAHMAYVLLARNGIDEKRFERIEGYADRSLKVPGDPEAARNRRIEILLRKQAS
jgi:chemotaxis protein MotB